jgi:hypothetical protein
MVFMNTINIGAFPLRLGSTETRVLGLATALLTFAASSAVAQNAPTLRQGNTEIGFFAGGGYGLGSSAGTVNGTAFSISERSFHVMGGGDVGYAVTKSLFLVGEGSYFPSISAATSSDLTYDRKIYEFNGGIHYRLPVPESRVVPYLAVGVGLAHFPGETASHTLTFLAGCSGSACTQTGKPLAIPGATGAEIAGGAGVRVYATEHFGFRGEFRIYRPFGIDNVSSFFRVTGGIFFQLK